MVRGTARPDSFFNAPQTSNFPWLCKFCQVVKSSVIHTFNKYIVYLFLRASFEERVYRGSFGNAVCNAFHPEQGFNYPYMPRPKDCCFLSSHEKIKMSLNRFSLRPVLLLTVKTVRLLDKYIRLQYYRFAEKICCSISYLQPLGVIINTVYFEGCIDQSDGQRYWPKVCL